MNDYTREDTNEFELVDTVLQKAVIKVIGVGGGGGNAVTHMAKSGVEDVHFISANTDAQALSSFDKPIIPLQLGGNLTKGLGAGAKPEVGRQAIMESVEQVAMTLDGVDMVFLTAGMGGGTGTGAIPVVAKMAKERNILTVAVVTRPFDYEGKPRIMAAEQGIEELKQYVDSLIVISNQRLLEVMGDEITLMNGFAKANEVLLNAVQGISELITRTGMINVDFADVRTVMSEMGMAVMGSATASGENRAEEAIRGAISSPLLGDINIQGARGILVNVTANEGLRMSELDAVGNVITEFASEEAKIVQGVVMEPRMEDKVRVTVVAAGIMEEERSGQPPRRDPLRGVKPSATRKELDTPPDMRVLDTPPVMRARSMGAERAESPPADVEKQLDLSAFLRSQAD